MNDKEKLEKLYKAEALGFELLGSFFKDTFAYVQLRREIEKLNQEFQNEFIVSTKPRTEVSEWRFQRIFYLKKTMVL